MITRITGKLVRLKDVDATLAVGAFEYQVLVPEIVRRRDILKKALAIFGRDE